MFGTHQFKGNDWNLWFFSMPFNYWEVETMKIQEEMACREVEDRVL